jgi:hypothetical protein
LGNHGPSGEPPKKRAKQSDSNAEPSVVPDQLMEWQAKKIARRAKQKLQKLAAVQKPKIVHLCEVFLILSLTFF